MASPAPAPKAPLTLTSIGAGNYQVAKPVTPTAGSNNNPFNIKVGTGTQQYITDGSASVGSAATDGGNFLKFNDRNTAVTAAQKLLFDSGVYKGLTVDQALKKWSNNGYGGSLVPSLATSSIDSLTPEQQTEVLNAMETKGENDANAPGTLTLSSIGSGNYQVSGKPPQTPLNTTGASASATTPPSWAPGGLQKPPTVSTQQPFIPSNMSGDENAAKSTLEGVASFLGSSEKGLGQEAAAAIGAPDATKNASAISADQNKNLQLAIQKVKELKAQGIDTSSAETHIEQMLGNTDTGASASETLPAVNDTAGDVALNAGGVVLDTLFPAGERKAAAGVAALGERTEKKVVAQIASDIAPKLSAGETADAITKQGTQKVGLLRRTVLKASKDAQNIASTIRKMVPDFKPGGYLVDNIEKTKDAVSTSVKNLASQVEKDGKNIAIPIREVTSKIDNAMQAPEVRIALKGTQYEKSVEAFGEEVGNIMKKNGGTPSGLLKSTQEFDGLVRKVYPNLYDKDFSPVRSAVKVIRDAMSDTVDSALPDTAYKTTRQAQSRLLTAIDNMAEKAASGAEKEIGTNALSKIGSTIAKNPVTSSILGTLGTLGVVQEAKKIPVIGDLIP